MGSGWSFLNSLGRQMADDIQREILRESDQAREICWGWGEKFRKKDGKNDKCPYFEANEWECELLRNKAPIRSVFGQRCLSELEFYIRARRILKKYPKRLKGEHFDLTDFIHGRHDDEHNFKGILDDWASVPGIHYMYSHINKRLYQYIETGLRTRKLVPGVKTCGTCIYRAQTPPHMCELEQFSKSVGAKYNPNFGTERLSSDKKCSGYKPLAVFQDSLNEQIYTTDNEGEIVRFEETHKILPRQASLAEALRDVPALFAALKTCAQNARTPGKAKIFDRWLEDNLLLFNIFCENPDISEPDAKGKLLDLRVKSGSGNARNNYSEKLRTDEKKLQNCISGEMPCQSKVSNHD